MQKLPVMGGRPEFMISVRSACHVAYPASITVPSGGPPGLSSAVNVTLHRPTMPTFDFSWLVPAADLRLAIAVAVTCGQLAAGPLQSPAPQAACAPVACTVATIPIPTAMLARASSVLMDVSPVRSGCNERVPVGESMCA